MNANSLSVGRIAHDLNNQIMILMNALDRMMILAPNEPDALRAVKAAEHCALLTSQLVPSASPCAAREKSFVREVVGEAAMLVRPFLPSFNRIEVDCHTDCRIAAPSSAMQQALVKLCIIARDSMDGPGVISITTEQTASSVILSVSDTGPAISPHVELTQVREIVEPFGGAVSVDGCLRITLPVLAHHDTLKVENSCD